MSTDLEFPSNTKGGVMIRYAISAIALTVISGCATGTDGAVEIGQDTYMIGGLGQMLDFSSSSVKARFFQQASKHCADKGMDMQPLNSTGQDSGYATYASAEVQFRCISRTAKSNTRTEGGKSSAGTEKWVATINAFMEMEASRPGGINYLQDKEKQALLYRYVKSLANDPTNDEQTMSWYLIQANQRVRKDLGLTP